MNRLTYFLCVSLPLTSIAFFSIGFAEFTLFNALLTLFLIYLLARSLQGKSVNLKVPFSLILLSLFLILSNLLNSPGFKVTSLIYSIVIIGELILMSKISQALTVQDTRKISRAVIALFFISIAIESIFIFLNIVPSGIWADVFPIYYYFDQTRPMGLSSEPSYAALSIVFALYVLIRSDNFQFNSKESLWYLFAMAGVILSGSSFGYALLGLLLGYCAIKGNFFSVALKFLVRNPLLGIFVACITMSAVIFFALNVAETKPFQRLLDIYKVLKESGVTLSGLANIATKDGSAAMRIVPSIKLLEYFSDTDLRFVLFGKGAGQATVFYSAIYGQLTLLGFIPSFIFNYGVVGFVVCLICLNPFFPKKGLLLTVLFFFFLLNADFNTQIFVYVMFTVMLSRQIEKRSSEDYQHSNMELALHPDIPDGER
jgi:hypothetical protein